MTKKRIQIIETVALTLALAILLTAIYCFNQYIVVELCNIDNSPLVTDFEAQLAHELSRMVKFIAFLNLLTGMLVGHIIFKIAVLIKRNINNNNKNKAETIV